jgi:K+-sensing histidine kinase KdpD
MEGVFYLGIEKNILVCVTQQKTCETLIKAAAKHKTSNNTELFVINVVKNDWNFLNSSREGEALEYLFGISKSVGANLTVLKSDNIIDTIANFTLENDIEHIFMGQSPDDFSENNFYSELSTILNNIEISIISHE